jgi:hypothetical protein
MYSLKKDLNQIKSRISKIESKQTELTNEFENIVYEKDVIQTDVNNLAFYLRTEV